MCGGGSAFKRREDSWQEAPRLSPLHLATGSVEAGPLSRRVYPWFHMVWTGLHVAPHATANVFSIRCLISRELASDEACWQRNGRESFRGLHQMAALLRHLGQNLVDGELAAVLLFFFFPFLLSLPLWQNVPDLTFIKFAFDFFTLFSQAASRCFLCHPLLPPSPATLRLGLPGRLALVSVGQALGGFWVFWIFLRASEVLRLRWYFSHAGLGVEGETLVLALTLCSLSLASHPSTFVFRDCGGHGFPWLCIFWGRVVGAGEKQALASPDPAPLTGLPWVTCERRLGPTPGPTAPVWLSPFMSEQVLSLLGALALSGKDPHALPFRNSAYKVLIKFHHAVTEWVNSHVMVNQARQPLTSWIYKR